MRDRERERDRMREKEKEKERNREKERKTERMREKQIETGRIIEKHRETKRNRQKKRYWEEVCCGQEISTMVSMLKKKADLEVMVRRKRVDWLAGLSSDWEFEESTKWKEDVPRLPGLRGWTGVKRSGSGAGGKPGKAK